MKKLLNHVRYWLKMPRSWRRCRRASCWDGENADRRMMNMLSPKFTDAKFDEYMKWMKGRGCDTAHLIFMNAGDGEGAGYSVLDNPALARRRIRRLFVNGFAIVPWLVTDDSPSYAQRLFQHPDDIVREMKDQKLFDHASFVCLGLEMDEPGSYPHGTTGWPRVCQAVSAILPKMKIATHHVSGRATYAGLGDIVCDQLAPRDATPARIKESVNRLRAMGKQVVGFEYERHPDRARAQAALDAGAFGVGNW